MKKNYSSPEFVRIDFFAEDVCTASAATLEANEFENQDQWWLDGGF
jgi:hypothetical protein